MTPKPSEKWYREHHLIVDCERNILLNAGSTSRAEQAIRDHNTAPALAEALEECARLLSDMPDFSREAWSVFDAESRTAVEQARAALATYRGEAQ